MLVCHCTLAGTKNCEQCSRYREYMGTDAPIEKTDNGFMNFNKGWICPVCGKGLSPYTSSCNCNRIAFVQDVTTSGAVPWRVIG